MEKRSRIIHNRIRCLKCGDIIESVSVHDFRICSCGVSAFDGGWNAELSLMENLTQIS